MRLLIGIALLVSGAMRLVQLASQLDCICANVALYHFMGVAVCIIGGFAVMLPDKER